MFAVLTVNSSVTISPSLRVTPLAIYFPFASAVIVSPASVVKLNELLSTDVVNDVYFVFVIDAGVLAGPRKFLL